jgi:hypothetical protein
MSYRPSDNFKKTKKRGSDNIFQKLPTFKDYINEELKDEEFKNFYEAEGRKLKINVKADRKE